MQSVLGLDFGTTNSAIATAYPNRTVYTPTFSQQGRSVHTYRSIIYFSFSTFDRNQQPVAFTGPSAIERYLYEGGDGRLIISPKTSLANPLFDYTRIKFKHYLLEDLIALILRDLCEQAQQQLGELATTVVAGRPVHFAGSEHIIDEDLAQKRLESALRQVGFQEIIFEYEPVAAAYTYDRQLDHDELILVADFGGGTTDFCVIEVGPSARKKPSSQRILGTDGVGVAGDILDSRIVHHVFSPHVGRNTQFRSQFGEILPMPVWLYSKLNQWYTIGLLRNKKTLNMLYDIMQHSLDPEKIETLIYFVEHELGFYLYRSTEQTKIQLSSQAQGSFVFTELPHLVQSSVRQADFEQWIQPDLQAIQSCCDRLMNNIGVSNQQIDRVFMTGGTSLVPSVRNLFVQRFGEDKVNDGETFTSVAQGLALRALDFI